MIPEKSVDCIIVDLPYGITHCRFDKSILPFDQLWQEWKRILKTPNSPVLLFSGGKFTPTVLTSNLPWWRYEYVWAKNTTTNFANAKRMPMRAHELVHVFAEKQPYYSSPDLKPCTIKRNKINMTGESYQSDTLKTNYVQTQTGYSRTVLNYKSVPTNKTVHPTEKPLELLEYLVKAHCPEGGVILDCCAGSGVTGIAAKKNGRKYILMEMDEKYHNIILERLK